MDARCVGRSSAIPIGCREFGLVQIFSQTMNKMNRYPYDPIPSVLKCLEDNIALSVGYLKPCETMSSFVSVVAR